MANIDEDDTSNDKKSATFLVNTFTMVSDPENSPYISWNDAGDEFVVQNEHQFASYILPKYFRHNNFSSFVRQLNFYSFRKRTQPPNLSHFKHPQFKRGRRDLLQNIKRKVSESANNVNMKETIDQLQKQVQVLEKQYEDIWKVQHHILFVLSRFMSRDTSESRLPAQSYQQNYNYLQMHPNQTSTQTQYLALGYDNSQANTTDSTTAVSPTPNTYITPYNPLTSANTPSTPGNYLTYENDLTRPAKRQNTSHYGDETITQLTAQPSPSPDPPASFTTHPIIPNYTPLNPTLPNLATTHTNPNPTLPNTTLPTNHILTSPLPNYSGNSDHYSSYSPSNSLNPVSDYTSFNMMPQSYNDSAYPNTNSNSAVYNQSRTKLDNTSQFNEYKDWKKNWDNIQTMVDALPVPSHTSGSTQTKEDVFAHNINSNFNTNTHQSQITNPQISYSQVPTTHSTHISPHSNTSMNNLIYSHMPHLHMNNDLSLFSSSLPHKPERQGATVEIMESNHDVEDSKLPNTKSTTSTSTSTFSEPSSITTFPTPPSKQLIPAPMTTSLSEYLPLQSTLFPMTSNFPNHASSSLQSGFYSNNPLYDDTDKNIDTLSSIESPLISSLPATLPTDLPFSLPTHINTVTPNTSTPTSTSQSYFQANGSK